MEEEKRGDEKEMSAKRNQSRSKRATSDLKTADAAHQDRSASPDPELENEASVPEPSLKAERPGPVSRDDLRAEQGPLDKEKRYIRLLADFENYKRHANAERDRLAGIGKEAVLEDIFPMVEHLERAIKAAEEGTVGRENRPEVAAIIKGLEMVYRELLGVLEKHGVERIPTLGLPFDPNLHEAAAVIPRPGVEENIIIEEIRPGFKRNGKLLRPASVVVAQ